MTRNSDLTVMEGRRSGNWVPVVAGPTDEVATVQQRLNKVNGDWHCVTVQPNEALGLRHVVAGGR